MGASTDTADREAIDAMNATPDLDEASLEEQAELEEEDSGQLAIAGTREGLTLSAGGKRPDASRSKVRAITLPTTGQFDKGETLRMVVDVVVSDVGFRDEEDRRGNTVRTWRTHTFTPKAIVGIEVSPEVE
jgi:hypothetical protein